MASRLNAAESSTLDSFGGNADPRLATIRSMHDRAQLFCAVLGVLTEDLFQLGREAIALSLLEFVDHELSRILACRVEDFTFAIACGDEDLAALAAEFAARRRELAPIMGGVRDGLDCLARAELPPDPVEFVVDATRYIETLKSMLRLLKTALQSAEPSGLDDARSAIRPDLLRERFAVLSG